MSIAAAASSEVRSLSATASAFTRKAGPATLTSTVLPFWETAPRFLSQRPSSSRVSPPFARPAAMAMVRL